MDFDTWLGNRLKELQTDEAVFGPYIKSIVEGDEELDEKVQELDGILGDLGAGNFSLNVEEFRDEIISRWKEGAGGTGTGDSDVKGVPNSHEDRGDGSTSLTNRLEQLMLDPLDEAKLGSSKDKTDGTDSALRAAILKQYQETENSSEELSEDGVVGKCSGPGESGLEKNTNAERVLNAQKEIKEKAKADAAKKREKDKEDRARQKKAAEERKEKAKKKTAKVERKRQ